MSIGNRLYDRADLNQRFGKLALYVDGALPSGRPMLAYSGRLQIHNAIGDCWAELTNGTLPPGASVTVDNTTHEVVVSWPAYSEAAVPVVDGDFEGDSTAWQLGYGWTIENKGANPGATSGVKAAALRGGGESYIEAAAFYPLSHVRPTLAWNAMVQQGGSSAGNVRAAAGVRFYTLDKRMVSEALGNIVKSGSDGEWKGSGSSVAIPASAELVRPVVWGLRKRQNRPLYVDDFTWDLQGVAVGVSSAATYPVTIRVHDAGGRLYDVHCTLVVELETDQFKNAVLATGPYSFVRCTEPSFNTNTSGPAADISGAGHNGLYAYNLNGQHGSLVPTDPNAKSLITSGTAYGVVCPVGATGTEFTFMFCRDGNLQQFGTSSVLARWPANGSYLIFSGGNLQLNGVNTGLTQAALVNGSSHIYFVRRRSTGSNIVTDVGVGTAPSLGVPTEVGIGWNYGYAEGAGGGYGEVATWPRYLTDAEIAAIIDAWHG